MQHRLVPFPASPLTIRQLELTTPAEPPSKSAHTMCRASHPAGPNHCFGRVDNHIPYTTSTECARCDHRHPHHLHGHYPTTTANIPGMHTASARVRAPEDVTTAPSAPTRKGVGGGGIFCVPYFSSGGGA